MTRIKFYVIYSADWGPEDYNGMKNLESYYVPPNADSQWEQTENGESEFSDVGLTEHRKWVTKEPLSRDDFERFIDKTGLEADSIKTLGSITLHGWLPAVSFNGDTPSEVIGAYVTPIIEGRTLKEDDWPRLRDAVVSKYGRFRVH